MKIAGINFEHFHMGDLLRLVHHHPKAELVAICDRDPARMRDAQKHFALHDSQVFTDVHRCLETAKPDLVILCPATADHAKWTEKVAAHNVHILIEKPFAASTSDADRMIAAMQRSGKKLAINWPLRWVASHVTTKRLIDEGRIGQVQEVHYYDGNRGPLFHGADKIEKEPTDAEKAASWFYHKSQGGGSLQDYLGYGTTLGTWFMSGKKPIEVLSIVDEKPGLEVDEHSITIARYERGLSKFETRWGTFTDPWTHQPQPKCGFVIKGSEGTISSYDYEPSIRLQDRLTPEGTEIKVAPLTPANPIEYMVDCIENDREVEGPLSPEIARIGQQIVDAACKSVSEKKLQKLETI